MQTSKNNSHKQLQTTIIVLGATFIGCLLIAIMIKIAPSPSSPEPVWSAPAGSYSIVKNDGTLKHLWSKPNIFSTTSPPASSPNLAAAKGKVFVIGSLSQIHNERLFALDSADGSLLWQQPNISPSGLYATSSALYIGLTLKITANDLQTGEPIWTKRLPFGQARNVTYLYVEDGLIYANGGASVDFILQADSGRIVGKSDKNVDPDYFDGDKVFTQRVKVIHPGRWAKGVTATDRQTGDVLWRNDIGIASNLTATETAVYLFTFDDKLLGFDTSTGQIITAVQFKIQPLTKDVLYSLDTGNYVAIDRDEGLLYVYLHHGRQLFAFEIVGYTGN